MPGARRWLGAALALTSAGLVLSWLAGSMMVRGSPSEVPPAAPPARDFRLRSTDGISLAATYRPGAREGGPAVLLLHGVGASRAASAPTARWLARLGYAVLAIDFRGHGESTVTPRSFGWNEAADAHAGFGWLKRRQRGAPVAVIGVSMGGAAALLGPSGPVRADALILQAVYPDMRRAIGNRLNAVVGAAGALLEPLLRYQAVSRFGIWPGQLSPRDALTRTRAPVLVIGGQRDRYTPPAETRSLYDAAPPGRRMLWLAPDADHGAASILSTPEYRRAVARFLRRTIGTAGPRIAGTVRSEPMAARLSAPQSSVGQKKGHRSRD